MLPQTSITFPNICNKYLNQEINVGQKRFLVWPMMLPTQIRWQNAVFKRWQTNLLPTEKLKLIILLPANFIASKLYCQQTLWPGNVVNLRCWQLYCQQKALTFFIFRCWQTEHVLCRMLVLAKMPGKVLKRCFCIFVPYLSITRNLSNPGVTRTMLSMERDQTEATQLLRSLRGPIFSQQAHISACSSIHLTQGPWHENATDQKWRHASGWNNQFAFPWEVSPFFHF